MTMVEGPWFFDSFGGDVTDEDDAAGECDEEAVDVALGDRAYDIVIGRGVLASLGARVAALRPGVRGAVAELAHRAQLDKRDLRRLGEALHALLTKRTDPLPSHRSQIAFPGGGKELKEDAWAAALPTSFAGRACLSS